MLPEEEGQDLSDWGPTYLGDAPAPLWFHILKRTPTLQCFAMLQAQPSFDITDEDAEGLGFLRFEHPWWMDVDLLKALLEAGVDPNCCGYDGGDSLMEYRTGWRSLDEEDAPWATLLLDYGCRFKPRDPITDVEQRYVGYAARSRKRRRAARRAAVAVIGCLRGPFQAPLGLGKHLARIVAQMVWATRRERSGVWQPFEE